MSVNSEIQRISSAVADAYDAVDDMGGTLPSSQVVANLADAIKTIPQSGGSAVVVTDETDSHGGTIKHISAVDLANDTVTAAHLEDGYTAHDRWGNPITGILSPGGGGGLEYETGTWTPTEDVVEYIIPFANTHTVAPFYYMIADATGTYDDALNSNYSVTYNNLGQAFASPIYAGSSSIQYGEVRVTSRNTNTSSFSKISSNLLYPYTSTGTASGSFPRYWATEIGIKAYGYNDSYYWRAGRTYKWIAVWAPTT